MSIFHRVSQGIEDLMDLQGNQDLTWVRNTYILVFSRVINNIQASFFFFLWSGRGWACRRNRRTRISRITSNRITYNDISASVAFYSLRRILTSYGLFWIQGARGFPGLPGLQGRKGPKVKKILPFVCRWFETVTKLSRTLIPTGTRWSCRTKRRVWGSWSQGMTLSWSRTIQKELKISPSIHQLLFI